MELMDAPGGPSSDEGVNTSPLFGSTTGRTEKILDRLVELLVLPLHPSLKSEGSFFPHGKEIEALHVEVQFCLWSMFMALAVYLELLNFTEINTRQRVSDVVSQFLADWRSGRTPALTDALDELIISQFRANGITDIPDMARLQRIKDCAPISSTVANYIKDLTMKLDRSSGSVESTASSIESLFPVSRNFIGRCFFPRLAAVSIKLLDLLRRDRELYVETGDSVESLCSALNSSLL